jgi:hypothetical protein
MLYADQSAMPIHIHKSPYRLQRRLGDAFRELVVHHGRVLRDDREEERLHARREPVEHGADPRGRQRLRERAGHDVRVRLRVGPAPHESGAPSSTREVEDADVGPALSERDVVIRLKERASRARVCGQVRLQQRV